MSPPLPLVLKLLAFTKLPPSTLPAVKFPVKLAVLPSNCKLTVKLFVVVLLDTLTKLAVAKLPKLALLNCALPVTVNTFPA